MPPNLACGPSKEETARQLADWKVDADLAGLREEDRIAALDENERARCRACRCSRR